MTQNLAALDAELNQMILTGKALEAFEKFYADDCVMVENFDEPCVGKDANRKRELDFFSKIEAWHGGAVGATGAGDDVTFSEWMMDVSFKGGGRVKMQQVAVRKWRDGQVVHERFYYKPAY